MWLKIEYVTEERSANIFSPAPRPQGDAWNQLYAVNFFAQSTSEYELLHFVTDVNKKHFVINLDIPLFSLIII